jgi:hypothetical protein
LESKIARKLILKGASPVGRPANGTTMIFDVFAKGEAVASLAKTRRSNLMSNVETAS